MDRREDPFIQIDEGRQRRHRRIGMPEQSPLRIMAEDHRIRAGAVEQADRGAAVARRQDRVLTLDHEQVGPAAVFFQDQLFDHAASEVRNHAVDRDPTTGDQHPVLAGGDEAGLGLVGLGLLEVAFKGQRHGGLADVRIGADGEQAAGLGPARLAGRDDAVIGSSPEVDQLDRIARGERHQIGIAVHALVQAADHPDTLTDRLVDVRADDVGQEAAGSVDPDHQPFDAQAHRLGDRTHHRNLRRHALEVAEIGPGVGRVDDAHDVFWPEAKQADRGLVAIDVTGAFGDHRQTAVDGTRRRQGEQSRHGPRISRWPGR